MTVDSHLANLYPPRSSYSDNGPDELGDYVTAYATDLADSAVIGFQLVMAGELVRYETLDRLPLTAIFRDATGEFTVHIPRWPQPLNGTIVLYGEVDDEGHLAAYKGWPADSIRRAGPQEFAYLVASVPPVDMSALGYWHNRA